MESIMRSFHWGAAIKTFIIIIIIIINTVLLQTRPLPWLRLHVAADFWVFMLIYIHMYLWPAAALMSQWREQVRANEASFIWLFCVTFSEFVLVQVLVWKLQNLQISLQVFLLKPRWRPVSKAASGWRRMWWWDLQVRSSPVRSGPVRLIFNAQGWTNSRSANL